jgi:hypothetical protein
MSRILNWLYKEFLEILPVWAFFFISFALVGLMKMSIFAEYHITPEEQPEFLVGSLIMAKAVLTIDSFFRVRRELGRPLIYGTLWNTGLYFVAAMVFHHVEHVVTYVRHQHVGFAAANRQAILAVEKPTFLMIMLLVLAFTFTFCMLRELIQAIGRERFIEMFFGRHPRPRTGEEDVRRVS